MSPDWIVHKGKRILYIDYSVCKDAQEVIAVVNRAKAIYDSPMPKLNVLANCELNMPSSPEVTKAISDLGVYAKKLDKINKRGLIGIDGLKMVFYRTYLMVSKDTSSQLFKTKEEALEWLAS